MRSIIRRPHVAISAITAALLVGACAGPSTQVEQTWAVHSAPAMHSAVVLFVGESLTLKHSAEDRLAADLRARGLAATPAYTILGDSKTSVDDAKTALAQKGYDGLITMRILDREQNIESYGGGGPYWGGYGWYGWGGWDDYTYTETNYRVETAAWDLHGDRLVWSTMTKTTDPENARELVKDTSEVVASRIIHPSAGAPMTAKR